jgi:hypothetical protein
MDPTLRWANSGNMNSVILRKSDGTEITLRINDRIQFIGYEGEDQNGDPIEVPKEGKISVFLGTANGSPTGEIAIRYKNPDGTWTVNISSVEDGYPYNILINVSIVGDSIEKIPLGGGRRIRRNRTKRHSRNSRRSSRKNKK